MRESGDALVESFGISLGLRVLDLGCGDGTTAVPAAKRGADVLGVDIASNLVDAGNRRAQAAGLTNCRFQEGDATNLHELADHSFDLVVSIFGVMFAPKPFDVAKEMVRVAREGGRVIMGNWIPSDPTLVAQILRISSAYTPAPPEGFVSPMTWGIEDNVVERFAARRSVSRANLFCPRNVYVRPGQFAIRVPRLVQDVLRTHHERVRRCRKEWSSGGPAERAGRSVQQSEQERKREYDVHPCNLFACDSGPVVALLLHCEPVAAGTSEPH